MPRKFRTVHKFGKKRKKKNALNFRGRRLQDTDARLPSAAIATVDIIAPVDEPSGTTDKEQYQFGQVTLEAAQIFYKTPLTMAFVNKMPVIPGHVLVAPLRPALRLCDLSTEEVQDLFLVVQKVQQAVEKHFGASSSTVSIQDGPDAGRSIHHLHVHVLPRKPGDFSRNDNIYTKLEEHDKDERKPKRSNEEMAQEAQQLRPLFY